MSDDKIEAWLRELTLEEKASLCSGKDFWSTKSVERLGIPSLVLTDGPHGLRMQAESSGSADLLNSLPATCFPTGAGLASTWNPEIAHEVGAAIGHEARAQGVAVLLGPSMNIKRSPLCGRNFEYLSEDPYLSGEIAVGHIKGVQSQGVGASAKHFAANNQETFRMSIDARVDERTLREIYLPAFESAVREARPWTVMSSYNRLNGTYASENGWLLTDVLRREWGFEGAVVSDWGACDDRVAGMAAGLDLEMPGGDGVTDREIVEALRSGSLSESVLDEAVRRLLRIAAEVADRGDEGEVDFDAHHALARRAAGESMVLLKNEGDILPLAEGESVAFIGAFARSPRFQGGGSSRIKPARADSLLRESRLIMGDRCRIDYAEGYRLDSTEADESLAEEAVAVARAASVAVLFVGLTEAFESEGYDRSRLGLPPNQTDLVERILRVQERVVVVLSNGSPVEMPWASRVPAILESYLGGQAWGGAVSDILFGRVNPSGKLAETFPVRLEDTPSYLNFPGGAYAVDYREGLFVGYRYYDSAKLAPLFPFGHGLSYTRFEYGAARADPVWEAEQGELFVHIPLMNAGTLAGAEVVQLYVSDLASSVIRPAQELKAFRKVFLRPGERTTVRLRLDLRSFSYWSDTARDWVCEDGDFELRVGSSSRDIRSVARVAVHGAVDASRRADMNTRLATLLGLQPIRASVERIRARFLKGFGEYETGSAEERMFEHMVDEMPLRNVSRMSGGAIGADLVRELVSAANGESDAAKLERMVSELERG